MSETFNLICHETKKYIWIGQGWGKMTGFYTGDPKVMKALKDFLNEHRNKPLYFMALHEFTDSMVDEYQEVECSVMSEGSPFHKSGVIIDLPEGIVKYEDDAINLLIDQEIGQQLGIKIEEGEEVFIYTEEMGTKLKVAPGHTLVKVRKICERSAHAKGDCPSRLPLVSEYGTYETITLKEWNERYATANGNQG